MQRMAGVCWLCLEEAQSRAEGVCDYILKDIWASDSLLISQDNAAQNLFCVWYSPAVLNIIHVVILQGNKCCFLSPLRFLCWLSHSCCSSSGTSSLRSRWCTLNSRRTKTRWRSCDSPCSRCASTPLPPAGLGLGQVLLSPSQEMDRFRRTRPHVWWRTLPAQTQY